MASNKMARMELERVYGKGCMFKRAHIAERIEAMGGIKTFRRFVETRHYKSRKIDRLLKTMTYHHLRHLEQGGRTDLPNGAVVSELAHQYLHSLPREQEEIVNNMLRQYKQEFELRGGLMVPLDDTITIQQPFSIQLDFDFELEDDEYIVIQVYDNTREDEDRRRFNRAKEKREIQKQIDDALWDLDL